MRQIDNTEPTQVQQPGRAAARTFWQTFIPALIGLVFILPEVLGILSSELGGLLAAGAARVAARCGRRRVRYRQRVGQDYGHSGGESLA